jgi:hypothetical protein
MMRGKFGHVCFEKADLDQKSWGVAVFGLMCPWYSLTISVSPRGPRMKNLLNMAILAAEIKAAAQRFYLCNTASKKLKATDTL